MLIPQTDGTGRCYPAHPFPKATKDPEYEMKWHGGGDWGYYHKKSGREVKIVGNKVTFLRDK